MYKANDIARAKANIARHEWARQLHANMRSWTKRYDGMDRERLRSFIPEKTPLITVKCPKCGNGPWYAYSLINNGDTLQCKSCESRFDFDANDTSETWNIHGVMRGHRLNHIMGSVEYLGLVYQIDGDMECARKAAVIVERPDAVALRLECGDDVTLILHATKPGQLRFGELSLNGRAAVARLQRGQLISLCLAAGTSATFGDVELRRKKPGDASWDR